MVGLGRDPEVAGAAASQTTPATPRAPAADSPTVTAGAPPCAVTFPREAADPYCLRAGEADRLLAGHPWHRFAVIGDSVAEGLGDRSPGYPDEPWCDRIAAELASHQPDFAYLNLGRMNTRLADVRAKQLGKALAFRPDIALAACGGYGLLLSRYDPDAAGEHLRAIVAAFVEQGCDVITVGMFDGSHAPGVPERFRAVLRQRLRDLSLRTEAISADLGAIFVALASHPASRDADIYSEDHRHGTMRGHAIAAAETIRALGAHLANVRTRR